MPAAADDDVVVHRDAEWRGSLDDVLGDRDSALDGVGSPDGWLCIKPRL